jgi:hypothetical protein
MPFLTIKINNMASLGKKILSVFVENDPTTSSGDARASASGTRQVAGKNTPHDTDMSGTAPDPATSRRFVEYFDKLFCDANIPGPDYYEFSRMTEAMQAIPDEQARFYAAYAGLQVQGLDKTKLLSTAGEYLRILAEDAGHFRTTLDAALETKVNNRSAEVKSATERIAALTQEIGGLQERIAALQKEIADNKEKIDNSSSGYAAEGDRRKNRIESDIKKIEHYIH